MDKQDWPDCMEKPNAEEFRKLFVGGLPPTATEESLQEYFQTYGAIESCDIVKEKNNQNKSKGFAFITFKTPASLEEIQKNRPHEVDGKKIETKRATPKSCPYWATKKLYFKGFAKEDEEEKLIADVKEKFSEFGEVKDVNLPKEKDNTLKGFGFIEFIEEDPVDKCNLLRKVDVKGRIFEVAKAFSQDRNMMGPRGYMYGPVNYYYQDYYYPQQWGYEPRYYDYPRNRRGGGGGRPYRGRRY
jgi:RNA recognition motif-containing protein